MADRENLSIADILAQARKEDGGESGDSSPAADSPAQPVEKVTAPSKPATPSGDPKSMSVADMLAAARGADSGETTKPQEDVEEATAAPTASTPSKPAGEMSMAEMLAAARGEKSGGAPAAKAKPQGKAAPKPKATGKAKSEPVAAKPTGPKDTASILAAARKTGKSGPISKAEAASRGKVDTDTSKPKKQAPPMPEKPGYARPEPARPRADTDDRRGFFGLFLGSYFAFGSTALALTHLLWTLGFARFMFPNILTEPPTKFKVGPTGGFAPGSVETKFKAQFGVWVVNALYQGVQIIFALKSVCTHLGCTPNWLEAEQKFKCPCHGSGFYKDGVNFEGPAPRPLERYAISVAADGQLEIDKSTTFQEEKGQWSDPTSFVEV